MKIRNNISILINEYWLRTITRYEQYYNLSLILNLLLTITFINLRTFFASKFQVEATSFPESVRGGECPPAPPWFQSSVFSFLKMWYDDSTARIDRFSHIALKLTLGLQILCSFLRIALFDGEIYPLEPISKGWTYTLLLYLWKNGHTCLFKFYFVRYCIKILYLN